LKEERKNEKNKRNKKEKKKKFLVEDYKMYFL